MITKNSLIKEVHDLKVIQKRLKEKVKQYIADNFKGLITINNLEYEIYNHQVRYIKVYESGQVVIGSSTGFEQSFSNLSTDDVYKVLMQLGKHLPQ